MDTTTHYDPTPVSSVSDSTIQGYGPVKKKRRRKGQDYAPTASSNSGAYQKPFPDAVWLHMVLLKNKGKTLKEALGEVNTLAQHVAGRTMHISTFRRAWRGETQRAITGLPAPVAKKRRALPHMKKTFDNPKSTNDRGNVEEALKLVIQVTHGDLKMTNKAIAEQTGLKVWTVRGLKNKTTWAWLYDVIEAQLYPQNQASDAKVEAVLIKAESKSPSPVPTEVIDLTEVDMDTSADPVSTPPRVVDPHLAPPPLRREDYFASRFPNGLPTVPAFPSLASLPGFGKYRQLMSAFSIPPPPVMTSDHQ
jgi:hypothetical protein